MPWTTVYPSKAEVMTEAEMRSFIAGCILSRLAAAGERRDEALRDVIGITVPDLDDSERARAAALVPELPAALYEKWVRMFADRLLETVPHDQVADLCQGTDESNATLQAVYAMFMESERMEKTVAEDLKELNASFADSPDGAADPAALVAAWLKARMGPVRK